MTGTYPFAVNGVGRLAGGCVHRTRFHAGNVMNFILPDTDRPGPGELLPLITAPCGDNPQFQVGSLGGRHLVLCIAGSEAATAAALDLLERAAASLPLARVACLGVVPEPDAPRWQARHPGLYLLRDGSSGLARALGFGPDGGALLVNPMQRVLVRGGLADLPAMLDHAAALCRPDQTPGPDGFAPVLVVPDVFEPAFCRHLIDLYHRQGSVESGFMRDVGGRTVGMIDPAFKRRRDMENMPEAERTAARQRIERRLIPVIGRAIQFRVTRMERYIVACYDGAEGGFFGAHRDNITRATAHRRLAVTINLNTDEYEGGGLRFPEFGPRTYRGPTGSAVVFSCSLLHEALPVTRGTRYAFIPFLYDEAAAKQREANAASLMGNEYKAG